MPLLTLKNIPQNLIKQNSVLGVDYGTKQIGLALSDRSWMVASPYKVLKHDKFSKVADEIFKFIDEEKIELIVIGLPLMLDGSVSKMQQAAQQFGRNLTKIRDINVCFYDERFSSVMAEKSMLEADISRQKRAEKIDKIAASYMLQGFLDYCEYNLKN